MKVDRMSKEDFIRNLQVIKEDLDFYDALYSVGRAFKRDDDVNILPQSVSVAIEALQVAIGDKYDYVMWWCFEKDWGERGPDFCVKGEDGNVIPTETMSDIYDLVTKNIESDVEE